MRSLSWGLFETNSYTLLTKMQWPFDTKRVSLKLRCQWALLIRIDFYYMVLCLIEKKKQNWRKVAKGYLFKYNNIYTQSRDPTEQLFVLIKLYAQLKVSNQLPLKSVGAFSVSFKGCWLGLQRGCCLIPESLPRPLRFFGRDPKIRDF